MPRLSIVRVLAAVAVMTIVTTLRADHWHSLGRHSGLGWGDGYHSRTACPPKRACVRSVQPATVPAKAVPWWMIPAESEKLPAPVPAEAFEGPAGQSLFRQPGDGSSIHASPGPSIMR